MKIKINIGPNLFELFETVNRDTVYCELCNAE